LAFAVLTIVKTKSERTRFLNFINLPEAIVFSPPIPKISICSSKTFHFIFSLTSFFAGPYREGVRKTNKKTAVPTKGTTVFSHSYQTKSQPD
jgi:hypothetical protein